MHISSKIPGLKLLTIGLAGYFALWISLEGSLWRVLIMGVGTAVVLCGHLVRRYLGNRTLSVGWWLSITAVLGFLVGIGCVGTTLAFMAVKTGLHAHGPEFSPAEISWVLRQLPLWGVTGLMVGTAVGLLSTGFYKK